MDNDKWIKLQMVKLPPQLVPKAYKGYKNKYDEAYEKEPVDHKKENVATRTANLALINYIKKVWKQ